MLKQQQVGSKKPAVTVSIGLSTQEEEEIRSKQPKMWMKTDAYMLSQSDRDILLHPAAWLNDNITSAAQMLLKKQAPLVGGFQPPYMGQLCAFDIEPGEFIQVLHDGHGHWLTVSTVGAEKEADVYVYDSMYSSFGTYTKKEIASILCTKKSEIQLKIMDVQMQAGGSDCGLFAIAFATAIVNGIPPEKFLFNPTRMRKHLYKCLQNERMTMFPTMKERRGATKAKSSNTINIFCVCRMPELQNIEMVACCKCKAWYHVHCVSVPQSVLKDRKVVWFCSDCNN